MSGKYVLVSFSYNNNNKSTKKKQTTGRLVDILVPSLEPVLFPSLQSVLFLVLFLPEQSSYCRMYLVLGPLSLQSDLPTHQGLPPLQDELVRFHRIIAVEWVLWRPSSPTLSQVF